MGIKVKVLERDFATGTPNIYYKIFNDAIDFAVYFNATQEETHLKIIAENDIPIAFFPSGGWLSVESIKE